MGHDGRVRVIQVTDYGSPFAGAFVPMLSAAPAGDERVRLGGSRRPPRAGSCSPLAARVSGGARLAGRLRSGRGPRALGRWLGELVERRTGADVPAHQLQRLRPRCREACVPSAGRADDLALPDGSVGVRPRAPAESHSLRDGGALRGAHPVRGPAPRRKRQGTWGARTEGRVLPECGRHQPLRRARKRPGARRSPVGTRPRGGDHGPPPRRSRLDARRAATSSSTRSSCSTDRTSSD